MIAETERATCCMRPHHSTAHQYHHQVYHKVLSNSASRLKTLLLGQYSELGKEVETTLLVEDGDEKRTVESPSDSEVFSAYQAK